MGSYSCWRKMSTTSKNRRFRIKPLGGRGDLAAARQRTQTHPVNVTPLGTASSCHGNRQERQPSRFRSASRNSDRSQARSQCPGVESPLKQSRTTNLGPFGELIRATGPMAKANSFRFSTKYQDDETDLLYYGYRYYNASPGRWLSTDPMWESAGKNLYDLARNDPVDKIDALGLVETPCRKCGVKKAKLEVFGVGGDTTGFHFHVSEKVVLRTDSPYDYTCCAIFKWQKGRDIVNGKPIARAAGGGPIDGNWHLDNFPWVNDQINDSNVHPMDFAGGTPGDEADYTGYDAPGISGTGGEPIPPGTTWSSTVSLRLDIRDRCHNFKRTATSNTITMKAYAKWPEVRYSYSN